MKRTLIITALILSGCAGPSSTGASGSAPAAWTAYGVATTADLPTCSGDILGRLYYVETPGQFELCKSTGWTVISINGTNGLTISSIKYCTKTSGGATFQHNIVTYSTGDKSVYCAISNSSSTYSASINYRSVQTGASTEGCSLTYDIDVGSAGFWYFSTNGTTRTTVYNDVGSASNGAIVTFAAGDCVTSP